MNNNQIKALAITVSVANLGLGVVIGYKIADKRLREKYEAQLLEDIASVKETYADMASKDGVFSTPEGAALALIPDEDREEIILEAGKAALAQYMGTPISEVSDEVARALDVEQHNVFDRAAADAELDEEGVPWDAGLPARESDRPYIISMEEFMESELSQITITCYDDGTVTDEKERILDDVDNLVGLHNLNLFGTGSHDDHIVYVRNEVIDTDFEIVKDDETYAVSVLGIKDEPEPVKPKARTRKPKASAGDD